MLSKKLIRNITLFYHETTHENPLVSLACYFFKINATPLLTCCKSYDVKYHGACSPLNVALFFLLRRHNVEIHLHGIVKF